MPPSTKHASPLDLCGSSRHEASSESRPRGWAASAQKMTGEGRKKTKAVIAKSAISKALPEITPVLTTQCGARKQDFAEVLDLVKNLPHHFAATMADEMEAEGFARRFVARADALFLEWVPVFEQFLGGAESAIEADHETWQNGNLTEAAAAQTGKEGESSNAETGAGEREGGGMEWQAENTPWDDDERIWGFKGGLGEHTREGEGDTRMEEARLAEPLPSAPSTPKAAEQG